MSDTKADIVEESQKEEISDEVSLSNAGLSKAVESYRKLRENDDLTDKERQEIEEKVKSIEERDVIENNTEHEAVELESKDGKILIGPPVLTRFEKARIMGARALQLSQGAPPFIEIPETAKTSLDIAMEELEQRIMPIIIRRMLPNGDYQNIPIDYFA